MTYSKDNQLRKYVKGYGFMSFAKNFGSKYGKKFLNKEISFSNRIKDTGNFIKNSASKFNESKYGKMLKTKDLAKGLENQGNQFGKIAGKKILTKSAEATGDLIGSKIEDKITSFKSKPQEKIESERFREKEEIIIPPEKRQQTLSDLRLF